VYACVCDCVFECICDCPKDRMGIEIKSVVDRFNEFSRKSSEEGNINLYTYICVRGPQKDPLKNFRSSDPCASSRQAKDR
jgi:hypothetical protein